MKVIDLINKIANGEEVPKKIKYDDDIYEYDYDEKDYAYFFIDHYNYLFDKDMMQILNDEVEIIEEKKIPEKLIPTSLKGIDNLDEKIDVAHIDTISAIETINEIIDYLKEKENK